MLSQAPEAQPECNVWHLGAGRADGSAGLWAAEGEVKEASQQTGLWGRVEATVGGGPQPNNMETNEEQAQLEV